MANNFLPFCPTDTGTNLLSQGDYAIATDRTIGNQPGVASSQLVNKALRQSAAMSSQVAQFLEDVTSTDILDNANQAQLLSQIKASLLRLAPVVTRLTSGSGTFNRSNVFFIAAGSATAGATYTNNGNTFTVTTTVSSGTMIYMTGDGEPTNSGSLTKASGTGDSTLTFYAVRKPVALNVQVMGGGGGGAGSGTSGSTSGTSGGTSSFGTSLITCTGGTGGALSGAQTAGGSPTVNSPGQTIIGYSGAQGAGAGVANNNSMIGAQGGASFFGGAGAPAGNSAGGGAVPGTGAGGASGGTNTTAASLTGSAGGAGGYAQALIPDPAATYAYAVGAGGSGGPAGVNGFTGGNGGSGIVIVTELFQ